MEKTITIQRNKVFFSILLSVFIFSAFFLNYLNVSAADCGGCGQPACPVTPPPTSPPPTSPSVIPTTCTCNACSASNWCSPMQYTGAGCPCSDTCSNHCECGATLESCKVTTTTTTLTITIGSDGFYHWNQCVSGICSSTKSPQTPMPGTSFCGSNSECVSGPPYSCKVCGSSTKKCELYDFENQCQNYCDNDTDCQEGTGMFSYLTCINGKCRSAASNYAQVDECSVDWECVDYVKKCSLSEVFDSKWYVIQRVYSCITAYGASGNNECQYSSDCYGGDDGGTTDGGGGEVTYQCFCGQQLTGTYTCHDCNGGTCCTECQGCDDDDNNNGNDNGGCPNGATQPCIASNNCDGTRTCTNNHWGPCVDIPNDGCPSPVEPLTKCRISEFSINGKTNEDRDPLLVWVNASLKGYISINDSCTECTVTSDDTWGNPSQTYIITSLSTYINETFKIHTSGTYSFELFCIGDPTDPDDFDENTISLKTVQAINLPWWREIIPVLPGFLRGIWE